MKTAGAEWRVAVVLFLIHWSWFSVAEESTHSYEHLRDPVRVVPPESIQPDRLYPAVFYFHGTGGKSSTGMMESYTKGIPSFVIGIGYQNQGLLQLADGMVEEELASFRTVLADLLTKYPIDPKKVFVSGFSKGGWMSAFLIEAEPRVAGAIVMGAGAMDGMDYFDERAANGKPVYIGIGIEEKNQVNSMRLVERMRALGARPTLEQWEETGHTMPRGDEGAVGLRQWLKLHLAPGTIDADGARAWAGERLQEIRAFEEDGRKYLALVRFKSLPYLQALGTQGQGIIDREIAEVRKTEEGSLEAQAWEGFDRLIRDELKDRSRTALERYLEGHKSIAERFPDTVSAKYALAAANRIGQVLGQ
ncbi:MAG: prolyl oligopeptidase family serine peptidase [Verrucomicrobiota bacterium]